MFLISSLPPLIARYCCLSTVNLGEHVGEVSALAWDFDNHRIYAGCQDTSIRWISLDSAMAGEGLKKDCIYRSSHHGFILTLKYVHKYLFSGAGDGVVKVWSTQNGLELKYCLESHMIANVYAVCICAEQGTIYTGYQNGTIKIWEMETFQLMRTLKCTHDILALVESGPGVLAATSNGDIISIERFQIQSMWAAHPSNIILAAMQLGSLLITGASDSNVKIWELKDGKKDSLVTESLNTYSKSTQIDTDCILQLLSSWVAIPSISGDTRYYEDCRHSASFLKDLLRHYGANAYLTYNGTVNPLVVGKFTTTSSQKTVVIYGHYDVVAPDGKWEQPAFQVTGIDGYLYGRGVTDNKGPVIAMVAAVAQLHTERKLKANVVFLVEGEEENGSAGLREMVEKQKEFIGDVEWILVSNSYWIGEDRPCLTCGLRGHIKATVEMECGVDRHSGVHGGGQEPLMQLIQVLSSLKDGNGRVRIEGFYDTVSNPSEAEIDQIIAMEEETGEKMLRARWLEPTLTVHSIEGGGAGVIAGKAVAHISMRTVPHMKSADVVAAFKAMCEGQGAIVHTEEIADWWKAHNGPWEQVAAAVTAEWEVPPLRIREGGSLPAIRWLELLLGAPAVLLPAGQASDAAHLPNERIRLRNLLALHRIVKSLLST